ncbi:MAG: amidohydrolase family protein, partial [Microcella sp.]|nr:amidohydrolase family protein [Microcella sp.]
MNHSVAPADLLFVNGVVYRGRGASEQLQVAVLDGRIAAVDSDLGAWRGPDTEVVELAGGMLHAGFIDAHVHPIQGGLERLGCDLSGYSTRAEYLEAIGRYASEHPADDSQPGSQ